MWLDKIFERLHRKHREPEMADAMCCEADDESTDAERRKEEKRRELERREHEARRWNDTIEGIVENMKKRE